MLGMRWIRRGFVVMLACSPAEPVVQVPAPPPPAAVEVAAPAALPVTRAPPRDCVEDAAVVADGAAPAWQLVGTASERPLVHAVESVVFVSAGPRLYDAAAGEPLVASTTRAIGLARRPVARMLGTWPDDAWLLTFEGAMTRGSGGHKFHLWRWQGERWARQTRAVLVGDGVPEVYRWTAGRVLELRCEDRPILGFVAHGGEGAAPAPLERADLTSFCPWLFFAAPSGEVFAVDPVRAEPPGLQVVRRCMTCDEPVREALPVPRPCGQPPTTSLWGLMAPVRPDPREAVIAVHTSVTVEDGLSRHSGTFLLRRGADAWTVEAVPGGGAIGGLTVAADGAQWAATDRLLRRAPGGVWTAVPLPGGAHAQDGVIDLAAVVTVGADEVWLVIEATHGGDSTWSVYRTGPVAAALNLDSGRPL